MRLTEPEKRLWKHMEYMINHWDKIVDEKTHKLYMNFDTESMIKNMKDWPEEDVKEYFRQFTAGEGTEYLGRTLAQLRRGLPAFASKNASEAESDVESFEQIDKRISEKVDVLYPTFGSNSKEGL
jgi:predicted HAD superfamily Cof-like phosphohydrolase